MVVEKKKRLGRQQVAVINDLLSGELDEGALLGEHKVSLATYRRWFGREEFIDGINARLVEANLLNNLLMVRYCQLAATKLVELTSSQNQETARKACLDIIRLGGRRIESKDGGGESVEEPVESELSADMASRILAMLAEE